MRNATRSQSVSVDYDQKALGVVYQIQNLFENMSKMAEPIGKPGEKDIKKVPSRVAESRFQNELYDLLQKQEKEIEKGFFGRIVSHYHFRSMEFVFLKKMHVCFIAALDLVEKNQSLLKTDDPSVSVIDLVDSILYAQLRVLGSTCSWHKSAVELSISDNFSILPQKTPIVFQDGQYEMSREVTQTSLIPFASRALQVEHDKLEMEKKIQEQVAKRQELEHEKRRVLEQFESKKAPSEASASRSRTDTVTPSSTIDIDARTAELEARLARAKEIKAAKTQRLNGTGVRDHGLFSQTAPISVQVPQSGMAVS